MARALHHRADIVALLRTEGPALAARFGAQELALFGSAARDELGPDSDVDVLVDFAGPASYDGYFGLKDGLERLLGRPVDLVTRRGLKPRAQALVQRDLIRVA